ncbi:MAG TPA: FCD domain-containing protein [Pilimelia sp.]|nr:FCD domain-containing protein [Pilimelia sp.]
MAVTDEAIAEIRRLIQSGALRPGDRLPGEQQLSARLGMSRSSLREATRALAMARVVEVRRGDGTYVTDLSPRLLLAGFAFAIDLLREESLLEVVETRRLLEPAATALAARRISPRRLADLRDALDDMRAAADDPAKLAHCHAAFHDIVIAAAGNEAVAAILGGLTGRTTRARGWRPPGGDGALRAIALHESIYRALKARDQDLARSTALVHVHDFEAWLRTRLAHHGRAGAGQP